jgi:glycosyltransferase involved in cell wall biosynthesis
MNSILSEATNRKRRVCAVIPVHNELENLPELVKRMVAVSSQLKRWDLEVLLVDDGSTDRTVEGIRKVRDSGIPIGYAALSKNFGHQAAMFAGMSLAHGDAIVTMDADLQHPPEEIPRMLEAMENGADVVQMVRSEAAQGTKGIFSKVFYAIFNSISETPIIPNAADFRMVDRQVLDVLLRIPERDKFLRGLIPSLGFKQIQLEYDEASRRHGKASFTFWKSLRLARKALFDFSLLPLKFVFWLGMGMATLSFCFAVGHLAWKLIGWKPVEPGFTDIITAIFFLSGCVLASVGILGRYLMMILEQVRGRPTFVIRDHVPGMPLAPTQQSTARPREALVG